MLTGPVLCITGDHLDSKLAAATIQGAGYEPLVTADSNEGLAVYFVNRKLEAVVLDDRNKESAGTSLVEALRSKPFSHLVESLACDKNGWHISAQRADDVLVWLAAVCSALASLVTLKTAGQLPANQVFQYDCGALTPTKYVKVSEHKQGREI